MIGIGVTVVIISYPVEETIRNNNFLLDNNAPILLDNGEPLEVD